MAEDRFSKINLYEPERVTLKMRILTDPPSPLVKEEKGVSWFDKVFNKITGKNNIKRNYRTINIDIVTSSAKKVFEYIDMTISEIEDIKIASDEFIQSEISGLQDVKEIYQSSISQASKFSDNSDKIIRFILDDLRLEDGFDFIPCLTIDQRKVIVEAFWNTNPILKETEKKAEMARREMENLVAILKNSKEAAELTKTN